MNKLPLEEITKLQSKIANLHTEQGKLLINLNRSLLVQHILDENNLAYTWPVKTQFRTSIPLPCKPTTCACTFKDATGKELLTLPHTEVPEKLWPEQLKKDLKGRR